MAQPVEIFGDVKGMTRDFAIDSLPKGYLFDLVDAVPFRRGSRVEGRGSWAYHGITAYGGTIYGGYYSAYTKGEKLLVVANSKVQDVNISTGALTDVGTAPATMVQNGVKLNDRVFFMDGAGLVVPRQLTYNGTTITNAALGVSAPKGKVGAAYKQRLVLGGDPANPQNAYFSPLEIDGGPAGTWDSVSWIGTAGEITGFAPMAGQILVFHPAMIERIRGSVPPGTNIDTDMFVETLTDQVGCVNPHTIVPWRENVIFADERGVFITDGSTVKNLTELGGMGDFWRMIYGNRASSPSVACGTFLDYLIVTVICTVPVVGEVPFTLVCDLSTRSWFRFTNFPATCYIPSESAMEQAYVGHRTTNRLATTSRMFQDPISVADPAPDYVDGNGVNVLPSLTTGFTRLADQEGMTRIRNIYVSYHHESHQRSLSADGVKVEYRVDPPQVKDLSEAMGGIAGWTEAGKLPDVDQYTRKRLDVGRRGYGVMVRISALTANRHSRYFSIGVERWTQDRGKVTT